MSKPEFLIRILFTFLFLGLLFLYLIWGRQFFFRRAAEKHFRKEFSILEKVLVALIVMVALTTFVAALSYMIGV